MEISQLTTVMDSMERDHQMLLEKVQALRDALREFEAPTGALCSNLDRLQRQNSSLAARLIQHVADVEKTLLPFLTQALPDEPEVVERLRQEHDDIHRQQAEFVSCLEIALALGDNVTHAVFLDVLAYGVELWDRLSSHVHHESKLVQKCFSRFLKTVPGM